MISIINDYKFKNGCIILILFLLSSCDDGIKKEYYPSGTLKAVYETKNGIKDGKYEYFDESTGKLISRQHYKNNVLDGVREYYYLNGKIKSITIYKNGMKNGVTLKYDSIGNLTGKFCYKNDLIHDTIRYYYANGTLKMFGIFREGAVLYRRNFDEEGNEIDQYRDLFIETEPKVIAASQEFYVNIIFYGPYPKSDLVYDYIIADHPIRDDDEFDTLNKGKYKTSAHGTTPKIKIGPLKQGKYYLSVRLAFFDLPIGKGYSFSNSFPIEVK